MKTWTLALALALAIACGNALPVPEDTSSATKSSAEDSKAPSVFEDIMHGAESQLKSVRSIASAGDSAKYVMDEGQPMERISKALEEVSQTLGAGFKNLGNSAIQILEGVDVAAEQALGTGARIVTGIAETAAETAETGARSAIRIANGVANTLTQGTKAIVDTKTTLLKGLTGAVPSSLQADASSTNEAVQRNERGSASSGFSGYPSSSYGPNTVAETPNNFINVFSQAAANTVNFGTQLLNSLVGVAANILQGTVSTLLSLLNAKGQVVGAVVQSAPPVLASVTRTAGDVLAAKARIFGAVTQSGTRLIKDNIGNVVNTTSQVASKVVDSGGRIVTASSKAFRISVGAIIKSYQSIMESAVNFASQLAQTVTNTFAGLFNGPNAINFNALTGGGRGDGGGSGPSAILGGVGNFAQTVINTKLNLLNGILSPFTGGRPLLNFGGGGGGSGSSSPFGPLAALFSPQSSSSSSGNGGYQSPSEPNFRITIAASTPSSASSSSTDSQSAGSGPLRPVRFFQPTANKATVPDDHGSPNLLASLGRGLFGMFNMLTNNGNNAAPYQSNRNRNNLNQDSDASSFLAQILPNQGRSSSVPISNNDQSSNAADAARKQIESIFSLLLPGGLNN